jgi:hypothetical protein
MKPVPAATESIEDFFASYTGHLTAGDIEALTASYNYPSLAVTAVGCLAITDPQQSRDFFSQGQHFYRSRGIQGGYAPSTSWPMSRFPASGWVVSRWRISTSAERR